MQSRALILRAGGLKENDRLITALTEDYGLLTAFANGAKRPKSPLHGATQCYAYGTLELTRKRDTYIVTGAQAEGVFFGLANDVSRLALANYFSALCAALCPREEPAPEHLRLALNALHFLCNGTRPQHLLKAVVELRLLCLGGYQPDLDRAYFDLGGRNLPLSPAAHEAVRFICAAPPERAFRFALPEEGLRSLADATQEYLFYQAGKRFEEAAYWAGLSS